MHCQKVRSYLSAYCNDELAGRRFLAMSDHLAICQHCRTEEQNYRDLKRSGQEFSAFKVSEGFNNRLLDRIAQERFAETRTKAYFPKPAPSLLVRRVLPILATVFLAVAMVITNYSPSKNSQPKNIASGDNGQLDNSYLTAQPVNNPNLTSMLHKGWTLGDQLARSERINLISHQLTFDFPFDTYNQGNAVNVSTSSSMPVPYVDGFYRVRPVIRVFESANPTTANKEARQTY